MKPTRLFLLLTALLAPGLLSAQSQVPQRISYQGIVTDLGNNLVGDPTPVNRTIIFRVWDNPSFAGVGNLVYSEEQVVTIAKGEFSVLIGGGANVTGTPLGFSETAKGPGTVNLANVFNGSGRYLGVTVDDGTAAADPEISPRQQIVTTAFAFRAKEAETVLGGSINNAALADNSISLLKMQAASVSSNVIVDGTITRDDIADSTITANKLDPTSIGFWTVSGGNVYRSSGNVGIGTASPSQKLEVAGNLRLSASGLSMWNGSGNGSTMSMTTAVQTNEIHGSSGGGADAGQLRLSAGGDSNTAHKTAIDLYGFDTNDMRFYTNGTERMRVANGGNIGVGVTSPVTGLHLQNSGTSFPATSGTTQSVGQTMRVQGGDNATLDFGSNSTAGAWLQSTDVSNLATNYPLLLNPNGGSVGIGTTTPGFPLTFGNTLGDKISLNGAPGSPNCYGLGIQSARLQIHTDGAASDIIFGHGSSAALTETMRIKGTGNVGIGTTAPGEKLEVVGNIRLSGGGIPMTNGSGNGSVRALSTAVLSNEINGSSGGGADAGQLRLSAGGANSIAHKTAIDLYGFDTNDMRFYTNGTERMRVANGGNVGIGTTTPTKGRLEVSGSTSVSLNTVYLENVNDAGKTYWNFGGNGDASVPIRDERTGGPFAHSVSIYASNDVAATGFAAFSDERIKRIDGRSDAEADLATLMKVEITDYHHLDAVAKGTGAQKKVIAQQVEKVFPQAVSTTTDAIPDIYRKAEIHDGWVTLATDLKQGERVRLIGAKDDAVHEVLEVAPGRFRTNFTPEGTEVFVYGREVNDFRSVDYDALAMLNVSATQQIKMEKDGEIAALQKENTELRSRLEALEAKDAARDAVLAAIEKRLSATEPAVQPVSLKTTAAAK